MAAGRRPFLALCATGGLIALSGCALGPLRSGKVSGRIVTNEALGDVNALRDGDGVAQLAYSSRASAAALDQAERMAASGKMAHTIGIRADFSRRMTRQNVPLPAAENIASGQETLARALAAWEASPNHRRNTLDPRFRGVGVALARDGDGMTYWAMVLSAS